MKQKCILPVIFAVCLLGITCSSCKQKTDSNSPGESNSLSIGAMSSMDFVPVAVAKKMNFFKQNGVDVSIEKFYSANDRDAAFQSGNIDGTVIDYTGAILQLAGGIPLKLTSACNAPFAIVSSPQSNIKSIEELKGNTIAVSRNTVIDFCIDIALLSKGLSETDIKKTEINKIPLRLEMMMKGDIQATALPDPFITIAKEKGCSVITDMQELNYQITGIMFNQKSIDSKKDAIKAFYKSYNQAVEYIKSHSVEDIKDILINEIGFPENLIEKVQLPDYTIAQAPDSKDIRVTTHWLKTKGLIPENVALAILDTQFVE
ncbi:MAG: ABC transporter substrate-binding protein [Dysgonamonadaceae bacterium]|jgi:NitT/TauT family transport system substrate-binding protein|nr:ABC transporter substrate-binding protein [Dysgonamonadaceae bacterium]